MEEVRSSILLSSTILVQALADAYGEAGAFFGGLVAAEGSFYETSNDGQFANTDPRRRFVFEISMASWDRRLLEAFQRFLGVGHLREVPPRRSHWQPIATLRVQAQSAHRNVTIPFAERFLPASAKRDQFDRWRMAFEAYERAHPSRFGLGPSTCSEPGCDRPVRGRGLCRSHYYRATGY